jgi:DNA-directed RNA polymerase subunit alpha
VEEVEEILDDDQLRLMDLLNHNVEELELSVRSSNCLRDAGIRTLGDLVRKTEAEMLKYRNFGRKSLQELVDILSDMGLAFGMDVDSLLEPGGVGEVAAPVVDVEEEEILDPMLDSEGEADLVEE